MPWIFTSISKVVAAALNWKQTHLLHLDDWLIVTPSYQDILKARSQVIQLTVDLGFIVNVEKSALAPSQQPTYLRAVLNTVQGRATPT